MLGVQNRNDLRRASLISEIYSETAGPTGGNVPIGGNSETGGNVQKVTKSGEQGKKEGKGLEKAGITQETLKNHPAFRPKRVTKSGLAKLSKMINTLFCMHSSTIISSFYNNFFKYWYFSFLS